MDVGYLPCRPAAEPNYCSWPSRSERSSHCIFSTEPPARGSFFPAVSPPARGGGSYCASCAWLNVSAESTRAPHISDDPLVSGTARRQAAATTVRPRIPRSTVDLMRTGRATRPARGAKRCSRLPSRNSTRRRVAPQATHLPRDTRVSVARAVLCGIPPSPSVHLSYHALRKVGRTWHVPRR